MGLIFDLEDFEPSMTLSDNMAMDFDGKLKMKMGNNMAIDLDTGDIHFTTSWPKKDDEDD